MSALSPSCQALLANSIYGIAGFTDSVQLIYCQLTAIQYKAYKYKYTLLYIDQGNDLSITISNGVH